MGLLLVAAVVPWEEADDVRGKMMKNLKSEVAKS